jgi:hypothetical protein
VVRTLTIEAHPSGTQGTIRKIVPPSWAKARWRQEKTMICWPLA